MRIELQYAGDFEENGKLHTDHILGIPLIRVKRTCEYIVQNPFEEPLKLNKTGFFHYGTVDVYSGGILDGDIGKEGWNREVERLIGFYFVMDNDSLPVKYIYLDYQVLAQIEEPTLCHKILEESSENIDENGAYIFYTIDFKREWPKLIFRAYSPRDIHPLEDGTSKFLVKYYLNEIYCCQDIFATTLLSVTNCFELTATSFPEDYHFAALPRFLCKNEENIFTSHDDRQIVYYGPLLPQSLAMLLWRKKIVDTEINFQKTTRSEEKEKRR
jgi:hypothetical protein